MSRPIKDLILNEGFTDIGTHEIEITQFEIPQIEKFELSERAIDQFWQNIFLFTYSGDKLPIPSDYIIEFTVFGADPNDVSIVKGSTNSEGFVLLNSDTYPVTVFTSGVQKTIQMGINGPNNSASEISYIQIKGESENLYYTQITDFVLHNNKFCVLINEVYYDVTLWEENNIETDTTVAININKNGRIYVNNGTWSNSDYTLKVFKFEIPDGLISIEDGVYEAGAVGEITQGKLGEDTFEDYEAIIYNRKPFYINVTGAVYTPDYSTNVVSFSFSNLLSGSKNISLVHTNSLPVNEDTSPTLANLQEYTDHEFAAEFIEFLEENNLNTLKTIQAAGPISYIKDLPSTPEADIKFLQAHVDLYTVNPKVNEEDNEDIVQQNEEVRSKGFTSINRIANTSREYFINEVVSPTSKIKLFKAAQLHETVTKGLKFLNNLKASTLANFQLKNNPEPENESSSYGDRISADNVSTCGCSDCQSNISPFAYLLDLLRYGANHVDKKSGANSYYYNHATGDIVAFINTIKADFLQPFDTINVDCATLHEEYCRTRLVTEVLYKGPLPVGNTNPKAIRLQQDKNNFLTLVYTNLLKKAGTSFEEVRSIMSIRSSPEKLEAAKKWSIKMGLPLYAPGSGNLSILYFWLRHDPTLPSYNILNDANLELVFGFRNISSFSLAPTPQSFLSGWQQLYLDSVWEKEDYYFGSFSRENQVGANPTYKSNWEPIIDPDFMGIQDLTYSFPYTGSSFPEPTLELWRHRKIDTDNFLIRYVNDTLSSKTSVDLNNRIIKVFNRDILNHILQNDEIRYETSSGVFTSYKVFQKKLDDTNTEIELTKSTPSVAQPAILQPYSSALNVKPKMRYKKVLSVESAIVTGATSVLLTWNDEVLKDHLVAGYIELRSVQSTSIVYSNLSGASNLISNIVFNVNNKEVSFDVTPAIPVGFNAGIIELVVEMEVELVSQPFPNPTLIVDDLFNHTITYTLVNTILGLSNKNYTVWALPASWPNGSNVGTTFENVKFIYNSIANNSAPDSYKSFVTSNLRCDLTTFNQLMKLLIACENYHKAMFRDNKPSVAELYELASLIRVCAKKELRDTWLKEEYLYEQQTGIKLETKLTNQRFWKSIVEPKTGAWDPTLQTIPDSSLTGQNWVAIIDPDLIAEKNLLQHTSAKIYRELYASRKTILKTVASDLTTNYYSFGTIAFEKLLNKVNKDDYNTPFVITPYTGYTDLINDLTSQDNFKIKKATNVVWDAFLINRDDFIALNSLKIKHETNNPNQFLNEPDLKKAIEILKIGYKRKNLYFKTTSYSGAWITQEMNGSFLNGDNKRVYYYNVINMSLAPGRGHQNARLEWQKTLERWNKNPIINPDIVPPQNVKNFVSSDYIYQLWMPRETEIDNLKTWLASLIKLNISSGSLFTNFKNVLDLTLSRPDLTATSVDLTNPYLPYFLKIEQLEKDGENIIPYVEQLGMSITEYRYLIRIYKTLEGATSIVLIQSEIDDIIDIIIHLRLKFNAFNWVNEEYLDKIILSSDGLIDTVIPAAPHKGGFIIYKPELISFPANEVNELSSWRVPYQEKAAWKELLEARNERAASIKQRWEESLQEIDDSFVPFMRDALIRAVSGNCESMDVAAERLAKTYFIETKDNCCVKHTRVSFAIETIQTFIFCTQNGIADEWHNNKYKIVAPNFDEEWKWIGTYSSWRSAMFVFLYPENLLYPSLKGLQSQGFQKLVEKLKNANSLSPDYACSLAKDYQNYFNDIQDLKVCCTTNADYHYINDNSQKCCEDSSSFAQAMTFVFAKGNSGASYWSMNGINATTYNASTHTFWEELPVRIDTGLTLLGCFVLSNRDQSWFPRDLSLWLFYSFVENGTLKLAYIKKSLLDSNSQWTSEKITKTLPTISNQSFSSIMACQQALDWDTPSFVLSARMSDGNYDNYHYIYDHRNDVFIYTNEHHIWGSTPVACIKHPIKNNNTNYNGDYRGTSLVYTNYIHTFIEVKGSSATKKDTIVPAYFPNPITGAVQHQDGSNVNNSNELFITVNSGNNLTAYVYSINKNEPFQATLSPVISFQGNYKIYPSYYKHLNAGTYVVEEYNGLKKLVQLSYTANPNQVFNFSGVYSPFLKKSATIIPIESADCTSDIGIRKTNIKLYFNLIGSTTPRNREYIYEAYYFVPMLLGQELQQRGQYLAALSWYRSVYDYTQHHVGFRKIFYGLELETATNTYNRYADWLLDPLNPHLIAATRAYAYTKYTLMSIIQCLYAYADRLFTMDTPETVPVARRYYTAALELLKANELQFKPNECDKIISTCVRNPIVINDPKPNYVVVERIAQTLGDIKDITGLEETADEIIEILNDDTGLTFAERVAEAFELIEERIPPPTTPKTFLTMANEMEAVNDDAFRYVFASDKAASINKSVQEGYAISVSQVSDVGIDVLYSAESETQLSWLKETSPTNDTPLTFNFFDATTGTQNFVGKSEYNPFDPNQTAYDSNLGHSNQNLSVTYFQPTNNQQPFVFTPLISFQFCMPKNPVYQSLYLKGNLELHKMFNCRNIAGMQRELSVYGAATNSISGMPIIGGGGNLLMPSAGAFAPSAYRFRALIERAKLIVGQSQQLESMFLSAMEKEDAENYNQILAKQGIESANATVKLQDLRVTQANSEIKVAELQVGKIQFTKGYYNNLIQRGVSANELESIRYLQSSIGYLNSAVNNQRAATFFMSTQLALLTTASLINLSNLDGILSMGAQAVESAAGAAGVAAQLEGNSAAINSTLSSRESIMSSIYAQTASYERRAEEWNLQFQLSEQDLGIAQQQIAVANDNVRVVSQEREIANLAVTHANQTLEYLKNKFSNAQLYNWMASVLEQSYSYMLNIATAVARTAERQLYFERQEEAGPFILDDYWEAKSAGLTASSAKPDRRGLTASARLLVDITRLDQYAFEKYKRKLQLTKVVSLSTIFPEEFQRFRETGVLNFQLTNRLFDHDFPGHYLRLISSVKTTVVGLVPVYDGIKATLTADTISYTVIGGNTYQKIPIRRMELDSVALTSAANATGVFELQPVNSDIMNPFEGMGLESRWEFKMPKFSNRMNYNNIADVLIAIDYTAFDSSVYREIVLQNIDRNLSFNRPFSFIYDFPDQWFELAEAEAGTNQFGVEFELKRENFPQGIENLRLNGSNIILYFVREEGYTKEIEVLDFNLKDLTNQCGGTTIEGVFPTAGLMNSLGSTNNSPVMKLRLLFDNKPENRNLFKQGKIRDILIVVGCKAELPEYPR